MEKETKDRRDEEDGGGLESTVDITDVDPSSCKDSEEDSDIDEIIETKEDGSKLGADTEREESSNGTYPTDCYTFMAVHGPFDKNFFFYFGFMVWLFQITFLILLVLRVAHPTLSTNENDDNPDQGQKEGFQLANFIPSQYNTLSKATQYMALASYCFFADASVRDIVTAIETFPNFSRIRSGDRVNLLILSPLLRLIQGFLATIVVLLLVINTSDVIDIILNFTAVNFISDFDDIAFELCKWGKYGPSLKAEAERIEKLPAPACIYRKYEHVRYRFTIIPLALALLTCLLLVSASQYSLETWVTTKLRVQFKRDPQREPFNGCYKYTMRQNRRLLFQGYEANAAEAKFGYCQDNKKWFLYTGNKTSPCETTEIEQIAFSSKTYAFDISTIFENTWYSPTGTPLELYFFDDQKNDLTDDECKQFLGDGICDEAFNIFDHNYDNGDCCGTTCDNMNCGIHNTLSTAFNNNITSGNGYHECYDPSMKNITIKLENVYIPPIPDYGVSIKREDVLRGYDPIDPLLKLDCDGRSILMVNIQAEMKFETERVLVPDGAKCKISIQNATGGLRQLQYVNYTIYHGDQESIEADPIVILHADSYEQGIYDFQRVPECFFTKLDGNVDRATIYTGTEPSNKAIKWLMDDFRGFSSCEYDTFLERYALATFNFAAPIQTRFEVRESGGLEWEWMAEKPAEERLWITSEAQCEWSSVLCLDGRVYELDLGRELTKHILTGTIATEIGLLKNLTWLDLSSNDFTGTIPSMIGDIQHLKFFAAPVNRLSGTIPSEIAKLSRLEYLLVVFNNLEGSIPTEIGNLSSLRGLFIGMNNFGGPIPNEVGRLSSLEYLTVDGNSMTGTLPTTLGELSNLRRIYTWDNLFSGTIPSQLASLPDLEGLQLSGNALTGSIPTEILDGSINTVDLAGNNFTNLVPMDGKIICSSEENGENYCNCNTDCSFNPEQCECAAAQSCCSLFLYGKEPCNVCDNIENDDHIVKEYTATCTDLKNLIREDIVQFGDPEICNGAAKAFFEGVGCRCNDHHDEGDGNWWDWWDDEHEDHHDDEDHHDSWDDHHDEHEDHHDDEDHHDSWDDHHDEHEDHHDDEDHHDSWDDHHDEHEDHHDDEDHHDSWDDHHDEHEDHHDDEDHHDSWDDHHDEHEDNHDDEDHHDSWDDHHDEHEDHTVSASVGDHNNIFAEDSSATEESPTEESSVTATTEGVMSGSVLI